MKTDNSLTYKIPLFSALLAVLIAVPLRVYQYFKIIDPETGFYNNVDFSVYIMYFILGASMIISIIMPYLKHKDMIPVSVCKKDPGYLAVSLIMAVGVIIDSAIMLVNYFELYSDGMASVYQTTSQYISNQGGTILLIQAILGIVAAVYFFVSGLTVGIGTSDGSKLKVLALAPTVWCIFRLLYRFKRTISFTNVSDLMLELFMIVFSMMFFLAFAQVIAKVDGQTVFWKIFSYGVPAATFALVCFIPRLIVIITGHADMLSKHYSLHISDITFAIFVAYNLITRARTIKASAKK